MSAKYAILGLVIERPGYGYQLAQRLEQRFGSSRPSPLPASTRRSTS